VKFFPGIRLGRVFVSKRVIGNVDAEQPQLLHQSGVAHTPLRPSGTAVINGKRVDVITEGPFIERGAPIKVVAVEGVRVVVRALNGETSNLRESKSINL
jgi:membrane-bound ClpP family serine protease